MRDALGDMLERAGDDEAAIGKSDQDDVVEILVQHVIDDVADMRAEADQRAGKVHPLADAGQARARHLVPFGAEQSAHMPEAMGAAPGAVNQDEFSHPMPLPASRYDRKRPYSTPASSGVNSYTDEQN